MPWKLRKKPPHNVEAFYFQNFSVFAMTLTSVLKVGNVAGSFFEQPSDTFWNTPHLLAIPITTLAPPNAKTSGRLVSNWSKGKKPFEPLHYSVRPQ